MTSNIFFQLFILLDVFIMGVVATFVALHARAHFKPEKHSAEAKNSTTAADHLPAAVKERLLKESEEKVESTLNHSTQALQRELDATLTRVNNMVERLASNIISGELERYQTDLATLHKQTTADLGKIKNDVSEHQEEIKAKVTAELEAEKQLLIKQIDTKLADAVGSFLTEALEHNIDLGGQSAYLISLLEEHKEDFIKGVADGTEAT